MTCNQRWMNPGQPTSLSAGWVLAALLLVVLSAIFTGSAEAAPCCGSVLAQGDRLGPDEKASLRVFVDGAFTTGWYSGTGDYQPLLPGQLDFDGQTGLGLAFRLAKPLQLLAGGAWHQGVRRFDGHLATGGALKDASLGLRYEPHILEGLAFVAMLSFPLGRTVEESRADLGADISGRGSFGARVAGSYEHYFDEWFLMGGLGLGATGPERSSGIDQNGSADFTLMGGYTFRKSAAIGLGIQGMLAPAWSRGGTPLSGSLRSRLGFSLDVGFPVLWRLRGNAGLRLNPPMHTTRNEAMEVGLNLGLRWLMR